MDTITEQLLAMESEAQEAMNDINKELIKLTNKAREEATRRIAEIENGNAAIIHAFMRDSEMETAEKILQIQAEYIKKAEEYEHEFAAVRGLLRGKIFHDVLYGDI